MVNDWTEVFLTDIYEIRSGLSKPAKEFGSGYPFLSFKNVFHNFFIPEQLTELVRSSEKERANCSIERGDVFLTRTSETMHELGMSCVALKDYENATFNGFTKRLRPKTNDGPLPEYVGYYLRSPKFRNEITSFSSLSTRASLNNEMIGRLKIVLPTSDEQKSIAYILKSLDDKIELNRKMNETLETMVQALFKSWFVDFDPVIDNALAAGSKIPDALKAKAELRKSLGDNRKPLPEEIRKEFPSSFEYSDEVGWIPEGWQIGNISDIARLVTNTVKPNDYPEKEWEHFSIPAFDDKTLPIKECGYSIKSGKYMVPKNAILSSKLNPRFPRVWLPNVKDENISICSTEFMPFIPLDDCDRPFLYSLFCSSTVQTEISSRATGSTGSRQRVSPKEIAVLPICITPKSLREKYSRLMYGNFEKIKTNIVEIETLSKIRDTLLPKLISGELRIPDAEKLVQEAI